MNPLVWPESKSFSDERMGQVPPKCRGICQNDTHFGVKCNRNFAGSYLLPSLFSIFLFILGNGQHTESADMIDRYVRLFEIIDNLRNKLG